MATGLRERKKVATRQAIGRAALTLATERGPGAVTVDDIAEAAGVSPRTVFNYFPTKEAAILGVDPDRRRELIERLDARPAAEAPLQALREALRASDDDDGDGAIAWRTRARLAREHPQLQSGYLAGFASLEDALTDAIARRTGVDPTVDPYPRLVATAALCALRVAVDHAIDQRRVDALPDAVDAAFAALTAGLPAPRSPR